MQTPHFIPSGEIGIALKWKATWRASWAESLGICWHDCSIFSVVSQFVMSLHQCVIGNCLERLANPALKWHFYVCTACWAIFVECIVGSMYCRTVLLPVMNVARAANASLFSLCSCSLKPAV